jgi:hypothetical protein
MEYFHTIIVVIVNMHGKTTIKKRNILFSNVKWVTNSDRLLALRFIYYDGLVFYTYIN